MPRQTHCTRTLGRLFAVCILVHTVGACRRAEPQIVEVDAAASYEGRTIRILVGTSAGGGQDLFARIMAPHFARHLPGHPSVIVENRPGAGGLLAADYLARRAAPDGLTIGLLGVQAVVAQLVGDSTPFDIAGLPLIGSPADDSTVCVFARGSGFTLEAWRRGRTPRMGMTNRGSTTALYALLLSEALRLPIRQIMGYGGTSDIRAAIASGEVDGVCTSRSSYLGSFQPNEDYEVVLRSAGGGEDDSLRAPSAESLVETERGRFLLSMISTVGILARYYALPPGTPAARIEGMRAAFDDTMADTDFLDAARAAGLEIRPQPATTVGEHMQRLLTLPPDARADLVALLARESR